MIMALRYRNSNGVRCAVCGVARTFYYRQPVGEEMLNFCSGAHIEAAKQNYQNNKSIQDGLIPIEEGEEDEPRS